MTKRVPRQLRDILPPEDILSSEEDRALYEHDSQKIYRRLPDLVLFPRKSEQVAALIALAREMSIPITPRGAGTGLSAGAVPMEGGWLLSFTRMREVLSLDPRERIAWVEPGLVNRELQELLAPHGLCFAPDPSSQTVATLGGNVAENAGGPHCLKIGVTSQHVFGLELVDDRGEIHRFGDPSLGADPLDLPGLITGSEGTLAVVTAMGLRLSPLPERVATLLAPFDSLESASRAVSLILARGQLPAALEMMDRDAIRTVEVSGKKTGYPDETEAALIVELDGLPEEVEEERAEASKLLEQAGALWVREARDEAHRQHLWRGRKSHFGATGRLYRDLLVQDICVPVSRLAEAVERVNACVRAEGLHVSSVYHAGDGNLHPNIGYDRGDPTQLASLHRACEGIMKIAVDLGGTLSGEHGIGAEKSDYMPIALSAADRAPMLRIKRALDPEGLFNPRKIFPREDEQTSSPSRLTVVSSPGKSSEPVFLRPEDAEELAASLRESGSELVFATGARVAEEIATLPGPVGRILSTASLTGIRDFSLADFQLEAEAGTPFNAVRDFLRESGQELDFDVPFSEQRSLAGVVSADEAWPFRRLNRSARDRLLAFDAVLPDGLRFRAGAGSVKNVTGYDLPRLMAGSRGSLAVFTGLRLRTRPIPAFRKLLVLDYSERETALRAGLELAARHDFFGGPLLLPRSFTLDDHPERPRLFLEISGRENLAPVMREKILASLGSAGLSPVEVWEEDNRGTIYSILRDFPQPPRSGEIRFLREYRGMGAALIAALPYLGSRWILDLASSRLRAEEQVAEPMQMLGNLGGALLDRRAKIVKRGVEAPSLYDTVPSRAFLERVVRGMDPSGRMAPGRWLLG